MKKLITSICMVLCLAFTYSNVQAQFCSTPTNFDITGVSGNIYTHDWDNMSGAVGYELYVRDAFGVLITTKFITGGTNSIYNLDIGEFGGQTIQTSVATDCGFGNTSFPTSSRTIATVADVIKTASKCTQIQTDQENHYVYNPENGNSFEADCFCDILEDIELEYYNVVQPPGGVTCNPDTENNWKCNLCECPERPSNPYTSFHGNHDNAYAYVIYETGELEGVMCALACGSQQTGCYECGTINDCKKQERIFGNEFLNDSYRMVNAGAGQFNLNLELKGEAHISIEVFATNGARVVTIVDDVIMPEGYSIISKDISALTTGIYLVQIQIGEEISHEKLFVR